MNLYHDPEDGLEAYREKLERERNLEMLETANRLLLNKPDKMLGEKLSNDDFEKAQVYLENPPTLALITCTVFWAAHERLLEQADRLRGMGLIDMADRSADKALKFAEIRDAIIARWPADLN